MLVVIILLAIFAAVVAPRVVSMGSRRAEADVKSVAALVSSAAMRDELTSQSIALSFDPDTSRLSMLSVQASSAQAAGAWAQDPLVPPVTLQEVRITTVQSGVRVLDPLRWRVEFPQIEPRERLGIELASIADDAVRWVVTLAPNATAATVRSSTDLDASGADIDLDQTGREEDSW